MSDTRSLSVEPPRWLTTAQLAELTGLNQQTIWRMLRDGKVPGTIRPAQRYLAPESAVAFLLRTVPPQAQS